MNKNSFCDDACRAPFACRRRMAGCRQPADEASPNKTLQSDGLSVARPSRRNASRSEQSGVTSGCVSPSYRAASNLARAGPRARPSVRLAMNQLRRHRRRRTNQPPALIAQGRSWVKRRKVRTGVGASATKRFRDDTQRTAARRIEEDDRCSLVRVCMVRRNKRRLRHWARRTRPSAIPASSASASGAQVGFRARGARR